MGIIKCTVHLILSLFYGYSTYVYVYNIHPPEEIQKLRTSIYGPFKYLTFWDLLLQWFFFSLLTLNYLCVGDPSVKRKKSALQKFIDFFFATVIFSTAAFVCVSFWSIFMVDRELIFPVIYDSFFPLWLNHAVHTLPIFAVTFELLVTNHSYPSQRKGFLSVAFFSLIYLGWVMYIAHTTGHWVYPILAKLQTIGRTSFILAMSVLIGIFYILGDCLHALRWGREEADVELIYHKKK